ncbi:MAG: M20/M25/M40 family metallo-hydrolase [bacterium]|nr:M20/M25/M40 family metallo-hydrolase [bacterium]
MSQRFEQAGAAIETRRVVEIARALCSVPSDDPQAEGPRAEIIAEALERAGADVHVADVVAGRPNVIARVRGEGKRPPLVLQGHIDAGVYPSGWTHSAHSPWESGGRLYGGGITDMLGGVAAMVAAVEAAAGFGPLPGDLILHATMYHDGIGLGAKYALATEGPSEGYGICGEPSDLNIHTGNGGAFKFEITLTGSPAHVSRMESAVDTLRPAAAIYDKLVDHEFAHQPEPRLPDLPRLLIGELKAGSSPTAVAESATITGDLRCVPGMDRITVRQEILDIVQSVVPDDVGHRVRIIGVHQPFLGATSGPLVDAITAAQTAIVGIAPRVTNELPGQAFVTDAADLAAAGLETVVYGVGAWHYAPDEWVWIEHLAGSARVYLAVAAMLGADT